MEPICKITQVKSDDENQIVFEVSVTQGAEQIESEDDLLEQIKNSTPDKKGIISIDRVSQNTWIIKTDK